MKLIKQKDYYGCGISCLAMLTNQSYETIKKDLTVPDEGLYVHQVLSYLESKGYTVKYRAKKYLKKGTHLAVLQFKVTKNYHGIIINDGNILCPLGYSKDYVKKRATIKMVIEVEPSSQGI